MTMPPQAPPGIDPTTGLPFQQPYPPAPVPVQPLIIQQQPPAPAASVLTPEIRALFDAELEAERARVRQEEKDKLYPVIEDLRGSVQVLTTEREERAAAEAARQQEAAEAERLRLEAEQSAVERLETRQREIEDQLAQARRDAEDARALAEKERSFAELETFRVQRVQEEIGNGSMAPQFADFVRGGTNDAIEQSIALAKQKTAEIVQEVQGQQLQSLRSTAPPPTGQPPIDLQSGEPTERTLTADDLRNMSMEEYAANRQSILRASSERVRSSGYGAV